MTNAIKPRLFTGSYWAILGANFMLFFAFYLIMPILPFYLKEIFNTPNSLIGIILACYTVAALTIRPFAGYLLDAMARKPLYIATFFFFVLFFGGYIASISLFMVIIQDFLIWWRHRNIPSGQ